MENNKVLYWNEQSINVDQFQKLKLLFNFVTNRKSIELFQLFEKEEKMTVTEIFIALRIEQSVASQLLAKAKKFNMVASERDGKFKIYQLDSFGWWNLGTLVEMLLHKTPWIDYKNEQTKYEVCKSCFRTILNKGIWNIIEYLHEHPESQVQSIHHDLEMEQSVCSYHLANLREIQLVKFRIEGKKRIYSLNTEQLDNVFIYSKIFLKNMELGETTKQLDNIFDPEKLNFVEPTKQKS